MRNRPARLTILLIVTALSCSVAIEAKVFLTQEEALALAFGEASRAERKTAFLTDEQVQRIKALAGSEPASRVVVYYWGASQAGAPITAFFDTHMVRTLPETVMVVVGGDSRIVRVDILSFDEPEDYLPRSRWLEQFEGRVLDEDLSTRRAIRAVTGATMSSRAVTETVRRALALHQVLREETTGGGSGEKPPSESGASHRSGGDQP